MRFKCAKCDAEFQIEVRHAAGPEEPSPGIIAAEERGHATGSAEATNLLLEYLQAKAARNGGYILAADLALPVKRSA